MECESLERCAAQIIAAASGKSRATSGGRLQDEMGDGGLTMKVTACTVSYAVSRGVRYGNVMNEERRDRNRQESDDVTTGAKRAGADKLPVALQARGRRAVGGRWAVGGRRARNLCPAPSGSPRRPAE